MRVFISWSGERSRAVAQLLHDWIPLVLHYVEPRLSECGAAPGERWSDTIADDLDASKFGIVCITRENLDAPWTLFELGALAKSLTSNRVMLLLVDLDVRDMAGPLSQFQARKLDKPGLEGLVLLMNGIATNSASEERVRSLYDALWPKFEEKMSSIPGDECARQSRPQGAILEDIVVSMRSLDTRLRSIPGEPATQSRPRRGRFHPSILDEFHCAVGGGPNDPIVLLMVASMFHEELPWLYELGTEAYKATQSESPEKAEAATSRFVRIVELFALGAFSSDETTVNSQEIRMALNALEQYRLNTTSPVPSPPRVARPGLGARPKKSSTE